MPVFGADISNNDVAWDETPTRTFAPANNLVFADAKYFVYHPMASLNHPFSQKEWSVVLSAVSRLRRRGYDSRAIRGAMNAFYVQRNDSGGTHPAYAFVHTTTLDRLMSVYDPVAVDSVMEFISAGFIRGTDELPWHRDDDTYIRRSVMTYADDLPYRYPDVVADILTNFGDSRTELDSQLRCVNEIVQWNIDTHVVLDIKDHLKRVKVTLPPELRSMRRSSTLVRKAASTLQEAVMRVAERGNRELRNTNRLEK
jgi:hypothetical protein